ncbi:MAG: reverse transcriptase/maturase family protein [Syntrophobacteraceae bacterium]|nr:reverse transcriptase/maturase family protein [Syntrophobacteraceae bacterium]
MMSEHTTLENLERAFRRVESGRGMPGVDGVTLETWRRDLPRRLEELGQDLARGTYRPLPLMACLTAGADGAPNPLFVPTVRDRTAQAAVVNVIEPSLEARFEEDPFPHRKTGCVRHAARRAGKLCREGFSRLVKADIASFFGSLDHGAILERLRDLVVDAAVVRLLGQMLRAEVYDGERLLGLERGIPRGTVLAPTLGKLFLDTLGETLSRRGWELIRYGHDLIVMAQRTGEAEDSLEISPEVLAQLEFDVDPEDPRVVEFWWEIEALGFLFPGDGLLSPFDRMPPPRTLLYRPPPFDLEGYPSMQARSGNSSDA